MQAMILAAGLGTRLRPFSLLRPKPLFPVFNKALLLLLIEQLRDAGAGRLVINAHHLAEQIVACLDGLPSITVLAEHAILGTGGGLRNALPFLSAEPLLVMNGDIVHNLDLGRLYKAHIAGGAPVSMVVHHLPRFTSLAVDERNRVVGIGDDRPRSGKIRHFAFTGIHIIDPALLTAIPDRSFYNIIDLYRRLIADGNPPRAIAVENHYWRDIGTVEDYLGLHGDLILRPDLLAPHLAGIGPLGLISPEAALHPGTKIIDWAVVGAGVKTGENVVLERTVVWENVRLPENAHLSNTVVANKNGVSDFSGM